MAIMKLKSVFNLENDESRTIVQNFIVYSLLTIISLIMMTVNLITKNNPMVIATLIFSVLNIINIILLLLKGIARRIAEMLFVIEFLVLFTFFLIIGSPDGFSALWVSMLPPFSLLVFKRKYGTITSMMMFAILVFLFWTPWGRSILEYDYNKSFLIRFPILYISFFAIAFFLETIITKTYSEVLAGRNRYEYLYLHDALTDIYNRYGFYKVQADLFKEKDNNRALAILDLDLFKKINDTYGHEKGDEVLQTLVYTIQKVIQEDAIVSRWGGDEFTILFNDSSNSVELCNRLLEEVRKCKFNFDGKVVNISISIGLVVGKDDSLDISEMAKQADSNLYKAKENGRNCLVDSNYNTEFIEN